MGSTNEVINDIKITDKAAEQIKRIKEENDIPQDFALRIGVKGGGCSGLTYHLGFDGENKVNDSIIEDKGVKLFVDGKSLFYLIFSV